ncbi:hypothetical protein [Candidatus Neptunochlamydia vexilliferae]|uniref:Uncharacterized protein n=1 Tax=Candidatus Neptunichlamydia vexilliferae TaxID=1651774 RepID=A0ABS0AX17_9BACT|nr:hypothetical protein [Candidatus Neptunochlamydia vexilliferae]MBF5058679.1 hypothetical protein [Candidatus Neptunochlamydia vexilliferae]
MATCKNIGNAANWSAFVDYKTTGQDTLIGGVALGFICLLGKKLDVVKLPKLDLNVSQAILGTLLSYSGSVGIRQAFFTENKEAGDTNKKSPIYKTAGLALILFALTLGTQYSKVKSLFGNKFVATLNREFAISMGIAGALTAVTGYLTREKVSSEDSLPSTGSNSNDSTPKQKETISNDD